MGNEFYPTPKNLIDKMLEGTDLSMVSSVLEPSAGKGDIVEVLREREENYGWKFDIDCIEMDRDLRFVLEGRGSRVVAGDFLQYNTMKEYDLIVMNPPFSTSSSHLMKALDLQVLLPKPEQHSVILERLKKAQKQEEATPQQENTQVADGNFLKAIVNQFQLEVTAGWS